MTNINGTGNVQDELNRCMPAAAHAKLGDVLNDLITRHNALVAALSSASYMVNSADLQIKGAGSPTVKAGDAFVALVENVAVGKPADTDMPELSGEIAAGKSALWAFYIDAAGDLSVSDKTDDADSPEDALADLPETPDGHVLIGYIVVENGTEDPFVGGTTALDAEDVDVTYYNAQNPAPLDDSLTVAPLGER